MSAVVSRAPLACWPRCAAQHDATAHAAEATARTLDFPRDHGAHLDSRIEWWYVTGWLQTRGQRDRASASSSPSSAPAPACARAPGQPLRRAPTAVRACRADRPRARQHLRTPSASRAGPATSPRMRATAIDARHRRAASAAGRCSAMPGRQPTAPRSATSSAQGFASRLQLAPRSRCCCKATPASRARARDATQASHYLSEPQLAVQRHADARRRHAPRGDAAAPGSTTNGATR